MEFRYDWLSNVQGMQREMERLLDYFGSSKPPLVHFARMWEPAIDVHETEKEVIVLVELAGVKQDEFEVVIDGNTLVIRGERKETPLRSRGTCYQMEIHRGPFERSILLPTTVDPDKTEASFEDGLLKIILPKTRLEQPLRVEIKTFGQT